jgi:phosphoserine phosphatase
MIIWDFDGTLYPLAPYDSEQTLLRMHLEHLDGPFRLPRKWLIHAVIHADRHQWFAGGNQRKLYRHLYGWCLKDVPITLLDRAAASIAASITQRDRHALHRMHDRGLCMLVISCGTLDLSERVLRKAGIRNCFESVHANPLRIKNGLVTGITPFLTTAEDKRRLGEQLAGGHAHGVVAVGDGYTDIPLLDWAETAVMIDLDGSKRLIYDGKPYHFAPSIAAVDKLLTNNVVRIMGENC